MEIIILAYIIYVVLVTILLCKVCVMTSDIKKIKNQYVNNSCGIHEILTLYFTGNISEAYNALNNRVYNLIYECLKDNPYTCYAQQQSVEIKDIIEKHKSVYKLLDKDMPKTLANFTIKECLEIKELLYKYE